MDVTQERAKLVKAAEEFLAAAKEFNGDPMARAALTEKADILRYFSEDGSGSINRINDSNHIKAALNLMISMDVFQKLPTEGSISSAELADAFGVDESVIQRAMRLICVQGIAEEPSPDRYAQNAKSLAYITGNSQFFWKLVSQLGTDNALMQLPGYFKAHTKSDLFDLRKSPFAFAKNSEGMAYYEVISADGERFEAFNKGLIHLNEYVPVLEMFPFSSMKAQVEAEPERPFIVDMGGGIGNVLKIILQEAPNGFGSEVILQDRPTVLDMVSKESLPNVTLMPHDFFTPQPVKNAHLYYLRFIIHDFYEPVCIDIVKNIASAMGPTSRLLIADSVVPEKTVVGEQMTVYWLDLSMMTLTGKEKTAKQLEYILNAAGLELVKIWHAASGPAAVIEARLKRQ